MRLFITSFAKVYEYKKFKKQVSRYIKGDWTKRKNIHLTFKFLGEVKNSKKIINALRGITYPRNKRIEFNSLEIFEGRTDILYCSTSFSKELYLLEKEICKRVAFLKFNTKDFIPHITLLRIKKIKKTEFKDYLSTFKGKKIAYMKIKLVLVKSTLTKNGPIYKVIKEF